MKRENIIKAIEKQVDFESMIYVDGDVLDNDITSVTSKNGVYGVYIGYDNDFIPLNQLDTDLLASIYEAIL